MGGSYEDLFIHSIFTTTTPVNHIITILAIKNIARMIVNADVFSKDLKK